MMEKPLKKFIPLLTVVFYWAAFLLGFRVFVYMMLGVLPSDWDQNIIFGVFGSITIIGLTAVILKYEKKTWAENGLSFDRGSLGRYFIGLLAGIVIATIIFLILQMLTPVTIVKEAEPDILLTLGLSIVILMGLGLMEEVAYRSYPMFKLESAYGVRASIYITSIAFAFYHGWHWGNLLGPGVWGLYYGLMAIWTRGIAMPLGFHVGINWAMTALGMKPHYVQGIWDLKEDAGTGYFATNQVGVGVQIVLLVVAVIGIEWNLRLRKESSS